MLQNGDGDSSIFNAQAPSLAPSFFINSDAVPAEAPNGGDAVGEPVGVGGSSSATSVPAPIGDESEVLPTVTPVNGEAGDQFPAVSPSTVGDPAGGGTGEGTFGQPTVGENGAVTSFPAPTFGGDNEETSSPFFGEGNSTEAPTMMGGGDMESPTMEEGMGMMTSAPSYGIIAPPSYAPVPAPTYTAPTYSMPAASEFDKPTSKPYVSTDDDPLKDDAEAGGSDSAWEWNTSTVDEMEHDETVIIALSTVFGVMFLFSILVAHQLLNNPHGCCAR
jgi:hypothetical protein